MSDRPIRLVLGLALLFGTAILPPLQASAGDGGRRGEDVGGFAGTGARDSAGPASGFGSSREARWGRDGRSGTSAGFVSSHRDGREFRRDRYGDGRRRDSLAEGIDRRSSFIRYRDGRRDERFGYRPDRPPFGDVYSRGFRGSRTLTTFDVGDRGGGRSFISYGAPPTDDVSLSARGLAIETGPKIIDVATARLDRRPIGPSGIDVIQTGGAKIIRIAPGYRMADAERKTRRTRDLGIQPWSSGWLSWCENAYRSFDAELGTYVARDGRVRFCQPE